MAFLRPASAILALVSLVLSGVVVAVPANAAPTELTGAETTPIGADLTAIGNVVLETVQGTASLVETTVTADCQGAVGTCGDPVTMSYGQGDQYRLLSFDVGSHTYRMLPASVGDGYTEVYREDNPEVTGVRHSIFAARKSEATPFNVLLSDDPGDRTMGDVLSSDIITEGSDNTFANDAESLNNNNVERISFMRDSPLATSDPAQVGLTLIDRGGNDPFKLAVVTAVDGENRPVGWGPLVEVSDEAWGSGAAAGEQGVVLADVASTVLRREQGEANYRPTTVTGSQTLAGMFVPLSRLGVGAGDYIYGISVLPADAPSASGISETGESEFSHTTNGTSEGGIDLVGGVFSTAKVPTASDDASSGAQGAAQTLTLSYESGDEAFSPIDQDRTTLVAPAAGSVSPEGAVTVPGEGTYTLNETATEVTFQPLPAFTGTATPLSYTVYDVQGASATAELTATVNTVAAPDTSKGPQGVAQSVDPLNNDDGAGVELDPATLALMNAANEATTKLTVEGEGVYTVADGRIVFTPEAAFIGTATPVRYQVDAKDDGTVDAPRNTVESTYTAGTEAVTPIANADATAGHQGLIQSVDPLANDKPDNTVVVLDASTLTLLDADDAPAAEVAIDGQGAYAITDGKIFFTPDRSFIGEAGPVTYRVANANGTTATATYTPTTMAVAPAAAADATGGPQGVVQSINPLSNDEPVNTIVPLEASTLTLLDADDAPAAEVAIDGQGTYTIAEGRIIFTAERSFIGAATPVSYRVANANGTTVRSTYTPTLKAVTPVAVADASEGFQGAPQEVDPLGNDTVGDLKVPLDAATLTLLDAAGTPATKAAVVGQGVFTVSGSKIVFTPRAAFSGEAEPVSYRVADANGTPTTSTYTPTVRAVAFLDQSTGPQGLPQTVDPLANDKDSVELAPSTLVMMEPDGNPVTTLVVDGEGVYTAADGRIVFTPETGFVGTAAPVRYQADDTEGNTVESTYTATTAAVTPVANADVGSGFQGLVLSLNPLLNDTSGHPRIPFDADTLTLLDAAGEPAGEVAIAGQGTYTVAGGRVVFTPDRAFAGAATPVTYRVANANGTTATSTVTVTSTAVTPVAAADTTEGMQGARQFLDPLINDRAGAAAIPLARAALTLLDADGVPAAGVNLQGQGAYTVGEGMILFTPGPAFFGKATTVSYRVADANGTTTTSTYTATVLPVAAPDASTGLQGVPQQVEPLANDGGDGVELDAATLTLVNDAEEQVSVLKIAGQGEYSIVGGEIVFTPEMGFVGEAPPVRYQVEDADGNTVESTYTPTITAAVPVAAPDVTTGIQGMPHSIDPFLNDGAGSPGVPLDIDTLTLLDLDDEPIEKVSIAGQGVYTISTGLDALAADGAFFGAATKVFYTSRIVFTPERTFTGTAQPVSYRVADINGTMTTSTYTPTITPVTPVASPDNTDGAQGDPQSIDPLANEAAGDSAIPFDPATLTLLDANGIPATRVVVPGEGVYTIVGGKIVFTPESSFTGTATPVSYRVADVNGTTIESTYTPIVTAGAPVEIGDIETTVRGDEGEPISIEPTELVDGLVPSSVQIVDPAGEFVDELTVPGEGLWSVDRATGTVTFTPYDGFTGNPTPVTIRGHLADGTGITGSLSAVYDRSSLLASTGANVGSAGIAALLLIAGGFALLTFRRPTRRSSRHRA